MSCRFPFSIDHDRGPWLEKAEISYEVENRLSITSLYAGLGARYAANGIQAGLLALLAFLPIGGLALLSPDQIQGEGSTEFLLAALLLSRFLTCPAAVMIVAYLARKDERIHTEHSIFRVVQKSALPSIGVVLGIVVFGLVSGLLFVVPGVIFFLASCVAVPVLVVEGGKGPDVVRRSWELTREHRWSLLLFWGSLLIASAGITLGVAAGVSHGAAVPAEPIPLVQKDMFLPLVITGALLYSMMVSASYEVYVRLASEDREAESAPVEEQEHE